jgi:hypothetical protein
MAKARNSPQHFSYFILSRARLQMNQQPIAELAPAQMQCISKLSDRASIPVKSLNFVPIDTQFDKEYSLMN